jgi:predicted HTH domain antitoxin
MGSGVASLPAKQVMDREAILDLVAEGRMSCRAAAQMLQVTPSEFAGLLHRRGMALVNYTEDALQQALEHFATRMQQ